MMMMMMRSHTHFEGGINVVLHHWRHMGRIVHYDDLSALDRLRRKTSCACNDWQKIRTLFHQCVVD